MTWHYETAISQVEMIIEKIERGDLDLDQIVAEFSRAAEILQACDAFLHSKRAQVELTIETLSDPTRVSPAPTLLEDGPEADDEGLRF